MTEKQTPSTDRTTAERLMAEARIRLPLLAADLEARGVPLDWIASCLIGAGLAVAIRDGGNEYAVEWFRAIAAAVENGSELPIAS